MKHRSIFYFLMITILLSISCQQQALPEEVTIDPEQNKEQLIALMQKHLDAVSKRDLSTLESTLHPDGKMQMILPQSEIFQGSEAFIKYHRDWFQSDGWSFETKVLNAEAGEQFGMAITEVVYKEPERDGKPYFNRMIVSYDLERVDGNWYVIKDHASSIEKSTDQ